MLQTSDLVGKPFQDGAMGPGKYCCWCLALEVFRRFGVALPDYQENCDSVASGVADNRNKWVQVSGEIPVPALMVLKTHGMPDHVGVYIGNGRFIHAHETAGVIINRTDHVFWKNRIEGYYIPGWLNETDICQESDHAR